MAEPSTSIEPCLTHWERFARQIYAEFAISGRWTQDIYSENGKTTDSVPVIPCAVTLEYMDRETVQESRQGLNNRGRILIVDDDSNIVQLLALVLTDEGYSVATAGNGQEALTLVSAFCPQLILLDLRMPVMDGWQFMDRYQARERPRFPIIVVSAETAPGERAARELASDFLAKPFELDHLLGLVEQHLRVA